MEATDAAYTIMCGELTRKRQTQQTLADADYKRNPPQIEKEAANTPYTINCQEIEKNQPNATYTIKCGQIEKEANTRVEIFTINHHQNEMEVVPKPQLAT